MMKSLFYLEPGRVEWREVPEPRLRGPGEALVRPIAAATCDSDRLVVQGRFPLPGPYAMGHEAVAVVVDAGEKVTGVEVGDTVIVPWEVSCGVCDRCLEGRTGRCAASAAYGFPVCADVGGLFADLVRVPYADAQLVRAPAGDPAELVSAADALAVAVAVLMPHLTARRMLILGWGGQGLYILQLARAYGLRGLVYVDSDEGNRDLATRLGATLVAERPGPELGVFDRVIDVSDHPDWPGLVVGTFMLAPDGVIECIGHYDDVPLPGWMAYGLGVTFHAGLLGARPYVEDAARLVASRRIVPSEVWSDTVDWDDLPDAIPEQGRKLVAVR